MSIKRNYIYNLIYQMVSLLVPLVTMPYVSKALGADGLGVFSFTNTNAHYFVLFASLGTTAYARREIAYKRDDKRNKSVAFWEMFALRSITSSCGILAYVIFLYFNKFDILTTLQGIYIVSVLFDVTWYYQGTEKFGKVVIRDVLLKLTIMIFIFAFVKDENDVAVYALGLASITLISNLALWIGLSKEVILVSLNDLKPFRHVIDSVRLFIPEIVSQIYLSMDVTMIGIMCIEDAQNGYYDQANKMINLCTTIVLSLTTVLSVRISNIYNKGDRKLMLDYMRRSFRAIWCISIPISLGILSISEKLILTYLGPGFAEASILINILSITPLIVGMISVTGSQYLVSTNRLNAFTVSVIIGAVVNFPLNMYLIPKYMARGAALATVIAEVSVLLYQIIYLCFVIKEIELRDIFGNSLKYCISGAVMFIVCRNVSKILRATYLNIGITVVIGGIIYLSMLLLMKDEMVIENILNRNIKYLKMKKRD